MYTSPAFSSNLPFNPTTPPPHTHTHINTHLTSTTYTKRNHPSHSFCAPPPVTPHSASFSVPLLQHPAMNPLALDPSPNLNHTFQIQLQPTSTALTLHHVITDLKAQLESGVVTVGYHWECWVCCGWVISLTRHWPMTSQPHRTTYFPFLASTPRSHRRPGCGFSSLPLSHYMDLSGVLRHPLCIFMVLIEAGYQASLAESQPHEECLTNVNQEQEKWRVTGGKGWG